MTLDITLTQEVTTIEVLSDGANVAGTLIGLHNADASAHGGAFTSPRVKVAFSWGDATPALIYTYTGTIFGASIVLQVPFDGVGAALSLGDSGNNGRLIAAIDPTIAATYSTSPAHTYASSTQIRLYITPGTGASQGSGFVLLEI